MKNYHECLGIKKAELGEENPSYTDTLNNVGIIYQKMGKYEEALKVYKQCIEILLMISGKKHSSYA